MRSLVAALLLIVAGRCWAAEAIVTDAETLILNGTSYRLEGVSAPQTDQVCVDETRAVWACGIEARDQLKAFIGKRDVRCDSKRSDPEYRNRLIGQCTVEGQAVSLNQWLVRQGWALEFGPDSRNRFKADQEAARDKHSGLWKGCFASPQAMRNRDKSEAVLLGWACPKDDDQATRNLLFPPNLAMPVGCSIKGKFALRAHITAHLGIYHLEGCKSYRRIKTPDRWFCSELEAQAAGFRMAFTCRSHNN